MNKPNFIVNTISFELLRDEVGVGKVCELAPQDAALLAPHIADHSETLYVACSGIDVSGTSGTLLGPGRQVAIEWVRQENNPQPNEPETNMYRYVFGLTSQGRCVGYEESDFKSTPNNLQVGDHWMEFDEVCRRYLT